LKFAEYYAKDLLTPVYVPDETDEEDLSGIECTDCRNQDSVYGFFHKFVNINGEGCLSRLKRFPRGIKLADEA
jgi:hypothetical protein